VTVRAPSHAPKSLSLASIHGTRHRPPNVSALRETASQSVGLRRSSRRQCDCAQVDGRGYSIAYSSRTKTSLSRLDSAPQTSPARPSSCRTAASGLGIGTLSNVSVAELNRTSAFAEKSLSHTPSRSSTYTAYGRGAPPGSAHSRQSPL